MKTGKLWFFTSYEYVHENASVAYSAKSLSEFSALAQLAAAGDLPNITSIGGVPTSVPVPFRDTLFSSRLDWTQSSRSQWFVRGSFDRDHTRNDLLQQGALPSTGATTTSNYYNILLNNQFQFTPSWLGTLTLEASGFHHTKARNSAIGEALNFPFTVSFLTTSGLETFGDNQFATAIAAFPRSATSRNINSAMTFPAPPVPTPSASASISSTNRFFAARLLATSKRFSPILKIPASTSRIPECYLLALR